MENDARARAVGLSREKELDIATGIVVGITQRPLRRFNGFRGLRNYAVSR